MINEDWDSEDEEEPQNPEGILTVGIWACSYSKLTARIDIDRESEA